MAKKRITELATETTLKDGQYVAIDHATDGTKKLNLGAELTDLKEELENISGISDDVKVALLQIASKVAYIDEDGQDYYDDLYDALYAVTSITLNESTIAINTIGGTSQLTATTIPSGATVTWQSSNESVATVDSTGLVTSTGLGSATITATAGSLFATCVVSVVEATVTNLSAVYTQSGSVFASTPLDDLKTDLVVTATYDDSSTDIISGDSYVLSGTLSEGTSTITVSFGGVTTTFNVTVSSNNNYVEIGTPTIVDNILTATNGNFIRTPSVFSPNGQSWKIRTKLRFNTVPNNWYSLMGTVNSDGSYAKVMQNQVNSSKQLAWYASSDATNWDVITNKYTQDFITANTWYYVELIFSGSEYRLNVYTNGWEGSVYRSINQASSTSILDGYYYGFGLTRSVEYPVADVSFDLTETKIYINNVLSWSAIIS